MGLVKEFMTFLKNYQVIGLAVAVIIGAAAGKLVSAFVNDIVMPIIGMLIPGGDWRTISIPVGSAKFLIGDFAGALVDFLIIAAVVFLIVKMVMKQDATKKV